MNWMDRWANDWSIVGGSVDRHADWERKEWIDRRAGHHPKAEEGRRPRGQYQ